MGVKNPQRTFSVAKNDYSRAAALYALGFPLLGGGGIEIVDLDSRTTRSGDLDAWSFGERSAYASLDLQSCLEAWLSPVPSPPLVSPLNPPQLLRLLMHNRRMLVLSARQGQPLWQQHCTCAVGCAATVLATYAKPGYTQTVDTSLDGGTSNTDVAAIALTLGMTLAARRRAVGQQWYLLAGNEHTPYTQAEIEARLHDESFMVAGGLSPLALCCAALHNRVMLGKLAPENGSLLLCKGLRQAVIPRHAARPLQERAARHLNT